MEKMRYERAVMEIFEFEVEDVLTTSGDPDLDPYEGGGY